MIAGGESGKIEAGNCFCFIKMAHNDTFTPGMIPFKPYKRYKGLQGGLYKAQSPPVELRIEKQHSDSLNV